MRVPDEFDQVVTNNKIEEAILNIKKYLSSWEIVVIALCCDCTGECGKVKNHAQRSSGKQGAIRKFNNDYLTNPNPENRKHVRIIFPSVVRWKFVKAFEIAFGMPIHHCGRSCDG